MTHVVRRTLRRWGPVRGMPLPRRAFTLVEVIAAIVVLSIAVTGLAGMTMWAGRRSAIAAMQEGRLAISAQLVDQLSAMPFDSLAGQVGCVSMPTKPFPHTHCVSVSILAPTQRRVTISILPASPFLRADSITFERTSAPPQSPIS